MNPRLETRGGRWRAALLPLFAALVLAGCATAPAELPTFTPPDFAALALSWLL